jgi:hypothetical protein
MGVFAPISYTKAGNVSLSFAPSPHPPTPTPVYTLFILLH